jgi:hypothetical protein
MNQGVNRVVVIGMGHEMSGESLGNAGIGHAAA